MASAESVIGFLQSAGAGRLRHAHGRSLLEHLVGTYEIVRRWEQPPWLQHAALIHSVYGTDAYDRRLLPESGRRDLGRVAGEQAERLAYLFCALDRGPLLAGTYRWAPGLAGDEASAVTRDELDALVLLHMANLAEQAQSADGSPGRWLVRLAELAELVRDSDAVTLPPFIARLAIFSAADESRTRRAYLGGIARGEEDIEGAMSRLALAAALCPAVAEPCIWLAQLSLCRGDAEAAPWWAACAGERLRRLGTAWDKRLSYGQWLELAGALERASPPPAGSPTATARDPRALHEAVVRAAAGTSSPPAGTSSPAETSPSPAAGRKRFHDYVETLAEGDAGAVYPDLPSRPWYDAEDFPLALRLESQYAQIRAEILALGPAPFHPESERIERTGDWDVAFFYERGRRHADVCEACPVTARAIESHPAMRAPGGLIYVSRMRGGTHIGAHRGPTNLRLRCHLGLRVPDGDCAIRVGAETRHWREGSCLVFDDHFEHEAWNHTDEDRIVLIVDMWHPGLSATEVRLLEGLQSYASAYGRRLIRYWSANAAAARAAGDR